MLIERPDGELFFKLYHALLFFVNRRLQVIPDLLATPKEVAFLPPEARVQIRDALVANVDLIQSFGDENPARLPDDELAIVRSWRHLVAGKFYIFHEMKKHTVFFSTEKEPVVYGVVALSQPVTELIGPNLPVLTETVLLPFKNVIVYDGLLNMFRISFGPGIRLSLLKNFKEAMERHGIVTSLPVAAQAPRAKPRPKAKPKDATAGVLTTITGLTDRFCREHLNDEYAVLCRELAGKLARKRPSPLLSGNPSTWASGIVRTIGWVNFLHDKSHSPSMRLGDIDAAFGISESTGAAKSGAIRKLLKIHHLDPVWTLPSRLDDNPLVWLLQVNGFTMDIRTAPRGAQEAAFAKGLIPYLPADRQSGK